MSETTSLSTTNEPLDDGRLAELIGECYADPLYHVMMSYPWGSDQLKEREPDAWQRSFLIELGEEVKKRGFDGVQPVAPIRFCTASGHGIGKSALVAWLIRWLMDTRPFCKGVVTANTAEQLRTKTWSELAKWHSMGLTKHWYQLNAGGGALNMYHLSSPANWRVDAQTCREENSDAFAGLHSASSTPFYIFDEASSVPDMIYQVREGGLTDGEPMTFDFGNPTRNSGQFYQQMVGRFRHRFIRRTIDSREVAITNKEQIATWAEDWGEDSDFFRVRVRGLFPKAGTTQFISTDLYFNNKMRDVYVGPHEPLVYGLDVARFGDDRSVLFKRRGRDAEAYPHIIWSGVDTMNLASMVAEEINKDRPDAVFIDGGGVGGGVVDRLRQLGHEVIEINSGEKATLPGYANMRAQMWGRMRDALKDGVRLPDNDDLMSDLTGVEYGFNLRNQLQLEKKADMKKRGLASPDMADALALTYAHPVNLAARPSHLGAPAEDREYDPFD